MIINDLRELIGNTPLLKLNHSGIKSTIGLYAKLEYLNPAGSVKDRTGYYMVKTAEENGNITPGKSTIIEATAGNTGIGIAFAALNKGYRVLFVVPENYSEEKLILMRALGAEIIHTPEEEGMLGAERKAEELQNVIPDSYMMQQFHNPANPLAHYETTGPEIYKDLHGKIDYFVAGAGSGGTYTGIMKYLKEQNPGIQGILADPVGSTMGGGEQGHYRIEGIGNDFIADTMEMRYVDKVIKVNDDEAFNAVRFLAKHEGVIIGSSSGAAFAAAKKLSETIESGTIVTLFPDRGDRYFSQHLYE